MTQNQMIAMVRKLISDEQATGYTEGGTLEQPEGTQELLVYLDRAVDEYSKRQAARNDIRLLKKITISTSVPLPIDFLALCGSVPVEVSGKMLTYYGNEDVMPIRYFARLPYVTSYGSTATLPYERDQEIAICALAAIYALNKHEFAVSQDLMLMGYGASNGNAQE